eukprot:gene509-5562_t
MRLDYDEASMLGEGDPDPAALGRALAMGEEGVQELVDDDDASDADEHGSTLPPPPRDAALAFLAEGGSMWGAARCAYAAGMLGLSHQPVVLAATTAIAWGSLGSLGGTAISAFRASFRRLGVPGAEEEGALPCVVRRRTLPRVAQMRSAAADLPLDAAR